MSHPIHDATETAVQSRSGNGHGSDRSHGHRQSGRARIEAAAAAAHAARLAMDELYANPLIARLDHEGLGNELSDLDREAVLTLVRSLEANAALPQRRPAGTGQQSEQRL